MTRRIAWPRIVAVSCLLALFFLAVTPQADARGYTRLQVSNRTSYTLNIFVNGGWVGPVAPHGTRSFNVPSGSSALKAVGPQGRVRTQQIYRHLQPNRTFNWTIHGR